MQKEIHQPKAKLLTLIGYFLVPLLLITPLLYYGFQEFNYSGLLKHHPQFAIPISLLYLAWISYLLLTSSTKNQNKTRYLIYFFIVLSLCSIFIPYKDDASIYDSIHLLVAYGSFLILQPLIFKHLQYEMKLRNIYLLVLLFGLLDTLTHSAITGLAQILFSSCVSILLTACKRKDYA